MKTVTRSVTKCLLARFAVRGTRTQICYNQARTKWGSYPRRTGYSTNTTEKAAEKLNDFKKSAKEFEDGVAKAAARARRPVATALQTLTTMTLVGAPFITLFISDKTRKSELDFLEGVLPENATKVRQKTYAKFDHIKEYQDSGKANTTDVVSDGLARTMAFMGDFALFWFGAKIIRFPMALIGLGRIFTTSGIFFLLWTMRDVPLFNALNFNSPFRYLFKIDVLDENGKITNDTWTKYKLNAIPAVLLAFSGTPLLIGASKVAMFAKGSAYAALLVAFGQTLFNPSGRNWVDHLAGARVYVNHKNSNKKSEDKSHDKNKDQKKKD